MAVRKKMWVAQRKAQPATASKSVRDQIIAKPINTAFRPKYLKAPIKTCTPVITVAISKNRTVVNNNG